MIIRKDIMIEDENNTEIVKACYICHSTEHLARDCPDKKDEESVCFICHKPGHKAFECRNKK